MQPDIPDTDDDLFAFICESVVDEVDRYLANADVTMTSLLNYHTWLKPF